MIDSAFEKVTRALEIVLAYAFVGAVALNFANVVGRYGFGRSIFGADEVQIYIMIGMTFLGAGIVTWRKQHLRMDVLVQYLPRWFRVALQVCELVLLALLGALVLVQSALYSWQMYVFARRSDNAGIPMWIPHSVVVLGFALVTLVVLWQLFRRVKPAPRGEEGNDGGARR